MWTGHACGKVILLGEHSVVYGQPALAAGLAGGADATFTPGEGPVVLDVRGVREGITRAHDEDLGRALGSLLDALGSLEGASHARPLGRPTCAPAPLPPLCGFGASDPRAAALPPARPSPPPPAPAPNSNAPANG